MSKQDSVQPKAQPGRKKAFVQGYMRETDGKERAVDAIVEGLRADYEAKQLPMPKTSKLRQMASELYDSSIENGPDNHLGTAAPRH